MRPRPASSTLILTVAAGRRRDHRLPRRLGRPGHRLRRGPSRRRSRRCRRWPRSSRRRRPATPRINSAAAFGVRPNHPVLYTVVATGEKPVTFAADGLPDGVTLDPATGRHDRGGGQAGHVRRHAARDQRQGGGRPSRSASSSATRIALTPPMGWNSWNCFAQDVSQAKVEAAADAMVSSGLVDHGWTYVNVDDCWEIPAGRPAAQRRAPDGHILTNAQVPRHAGDGRPHPRQGVAGRPLQQPRHQHLRRVHRPASSTSGRTPPSTPPGGSTT